MARIFVINGHQPYPFAKGRLNTTLTERASAHFEARGDEVKLTRTAGEWDVNDEVERHQWADALFIQFPVNWMGTSWSFKKYMDEVYTAGMDGRLCVGDGRHGPGEGKKYGTSGTLGNKPYMLSATFNAPADSFDDPEAWLFQGASVDDLLRPLHLNLKFFAASPLPTFSAHDVMKNADIESDLKRFDAHLGHHFPRTGGIVA